MKKIFKNFLKIVWLNSAKLNNQIITSLITPSKHAKILDVGCADGREIIKMVKNIKNSQIWGVDIESQAVLTAKKLGIKAAKSNIEEGLPFRSNFFDVVIANQIIEHVHNVDFFVKEIKRVIKPNGFLIVSTENLSSWHNLFALLLGWQAFSQHISTLANIGNPMRMANYTGYNIYGMHDKIFTPRGLKELFELYGFKIEKSFGAGYYPFTSIVSRTLSHIDPAHTAFIGLKARKVS